MHTPHSPKRLGEFAHLTASLTAYTATLAAEAPPADEITPLPTGWSGVIGMEEEITGDGRLIENGALNWSTPVPLRFVLQDNGGHDGAVTVGRILSISRGEGGRIEAAGDFDLGSEHGREAARLVQGEILTGVSMDLDNITFDIRVAREVFDSMSEAPVMEEAPAEPADPETDENGRVTVVSMSADDEVMVTTDARIRAATLVSIPAFSTATLAAGDAPVTERETDSEGALVASAAPVEPPREWFTFAEGPAPTPLTITDEGHIYGHLATWDTCHTADPSGAGICVMAPKSPTGYSYFHSGAVKTAEGDQVDTGVIRFRTGHASLKMNPSDASAHYDNTGMAGADVHAIDGVHGVWVTGAIRPNLSPEQVRELRAAPLSGDWRYVNGKLDLIGALAVNLPGFPVPRTQGLVASGEMSAIVAAGIVAPVLDPSTLGLSEADTRAFHRLLDHEKSRERANLKARALSAKSKQKVAAMAAKRSKDHMATIRKAD